MIVAGNFAQTRGVKAENNVLLLSKRKRTVLLLWWSSVSIH